MIILKEALALVQQAKVEVASAEFSKPTPYFYVYLF